MKKILFTAAAFIFIPFCLNANNLPFAHDISIRDAGMSGASAPFKGDSFSAFVNPAGLASAGMQEASLLYHGLFEGASFTAFSYSHPVYSIGTFAASFSYLRISDIEELSETSLPTGYKYSDSYAMLAASYGFSPASFIDAGFALKFLNHNFYTLNASAYGADAGLVASLPYGLSLSLYTENLIKPVFDFEDSGSSVIPMFFRATGGYEAAFPGAFEGVLRVAAGISKEEHAENSGWHAGAEYSFYNTVYLRAGVSDTGFTAGCSASYSGVSVHYALQRKPLDFLHRFSVSYSFGEDMRLLESNTKTKEDKIRYDLINKVKNEALEQLAEEIEDLMFYGEYDRALVSISKALAWDSGNLKMLAKKKDAEELLKGKGVSILIKDADDLAAKGRHIDALVKIKSALDISPADKNLWEKFRSMQSNIQKSAEENIIAEAKNETFIRTHFDKGLSNYSEGKFEEAVKEWDKVIKASPLQRQVYSFIQSAQAKITEKKDTAVKAATDKKEKLSALYNRAALLHSQGKFEESINAWRDLLELDPANEEAKKILDKVTREYKEMQLRRVVW